MNSVAKLNHASIQLETILPSACKVCGCFPSQQRRYNWKLDFPRAGIYTDCFPQKPSKYIYLSCPTPEVRVKTLVWVPVPQWISCFVKIAQLFQKFIPKKKGSNENFHTTRPVGRPRTRWEDVVQRDALQLLGTRGWRIRATNRDEWRRLVREAKARKGL